MRHACYPSGMIDFMNKTVVFESFKNTTREVALAERHVGTDAWGKSASDDECDCTRPGGRTTYFLCGKKAAGLLVTDQGVVRQACKTHLNAAARRRTNGYFTDPIAICTLDGEQTHEWVRTSAGRGYFTKREG